MKRMFIQFRQGIVRTVNDSFSSCLMLLVMIFLFVGTSFMPTTMLAADKTAQSSIHQQTRIMVTTAEFNATMEDWRQFQLDLLGTYWNAQYNTTEIQVCVEHTLLVSDETATLEIDQFNTALGTLTEVEVVVQGSLMANAWEDTANGTEYMLSLNSTLLYQLPGDTEKSMPVSNKTNQRTYNEYIAQQGFQVNGWNMIEARTTYSTQLNAFQGSGKLQIPIQAKDLVNFHDDASDITSSLKTNICVIYKYQ